MNFSALLHYPSGLMATLQSGLSSHRQIYAEIIGTEGSISIHDTFPNLMIVDKHGSRCPDTTYWPTLHGRLQGALRDELAYFINCVATGQRPDIISPEESREAVRACLAAEQSAATGQPIAIEP